MSKRKQHTTEFGEADAGETREPNLPETDLATIPFPVSDPKAEFLLFMFERKLPYDPRWVSGHDEIVRAEFAQAMADGQRPEQFFRENLAYMGHLIHLETDFYRDPYIRIITEILPAPRTLLDWGCGSGGTGFKFSGRGYDVSFAKYADSIGQEFLQWRLGHRGMTNKVYGFDDEIPPHDIVAAFDVVEHASDPYEELARLEQVGKIIAVNIPKHKGMPEREEGGMPQLHYKMDVDGIVAHIQANHKVLRIEDVDYAVFVIYESAPQAKVEN